MAKKKRLSLAEQYDLKTNGYGANGSTGMWTSLSSKTTSSFGLLEALKIETNPEIRIKIIEALENKWIYFYK